MAVHYNTLVPAGTALVSAVASATVQAVTPHAGAPATTPWLAMLVPIISAAIGGAVSYGILKGTVQAVKDSHADMSRSVKDIHNNVTRLVDRVSNIEGRIGRRRSDPHVDFDQ